MITYIKLMTEKVYMFMYIFCMKLLCTACLHIMEEVCSLKYVYIMKFFSINSIERVKLAAAILSIKQWMIGW
jgi:hypothetical protein